MESEDDPRGAVRAGVFDIFSKWSEYGSNKMTPIWIEEGDGELYNLDERKTPRSRSPKELRRSVERLAEGVWK